MAQSSHTKVLKQGITWNRLPHTSLERAEGKYSTDQYESGILGAAGKSFEVLLDG